MRTVSDMIMLTILGLLIGVIFLEWMVGCGQVTYFADGTWATNECIWAGREMQTGTWK